MKPKRFLAAILAALAVGSGLFMRGDVSAATLTSRVIVNIDSSLTSALDLVTAGAPLTIRSTQDFSSGVTANAADKVWSDTRTIAASTTEDLDFKGSLTDAFGAAFTPAKIRVLYIKASSSNTNDLVVFGDAASIPFFSDVTVTTSVKPGGILLIVAPNLAGFAVTATTGDIVQVANGGAGTTVTYDILAIGTSS